MAKHPRDVSISDLEDPAFVKHCETQYPDRPLEPYNEDFDRSAKGSTAEEYGDQFRQAQTRKMIRRYREWKVRQMHDTTTNNTPLSKDHAESHRVARLVRPRVSQCHHNAYRVLETLPDYADAVYVEGIAIRSGESPMEHGWLERDGKIIDPTIPDDQAGPYFAGLRFVGRQGFWEAQRSTPMGEDKVLVPFFYRLGFGGSDSPEMRDAWRQAWEWLGHPEIAARFVVAWRSRPHPSEEVFQALRSDPAVNQIDPDVAVQVGIK